MTQCTETGHGQQPESIKQNKVEDIGNIEKVEKIDIAEKVKGTEQEWKKVEDSVPAPWGWVCVG